MEQGARGMGKEADTNAPNELIFVVPLLNVVRRGDAARDAHDKGGARRELNEAHAVVGARDGITPRCPEAVLRDLNDKGGAALPLARHARRCRRLVQHLHRVRLPHHLCCPRADALEVEVPRRIALIKIIVLTAAVIVINLCALRALLARGVLVSGGGVLRGG